MSKQKVAILGASDKPERYSYKAMNALIQSGHEVFLITPRLKTIDNHKCYKDLNELKDIDTLTLYIGPQLSIKMKDEIIRLNPKRIIFNPGTENSKLSELLQTTKIKQEEACTLVLLSTNQF